MPRPRKSNKKPIDLKVQRGTSTRLLSVGKILPPDWEWVRVIVENESEDTVWLKLQRLTLQKQ